MATLKSISVWLVWLSYLSACRCYSTYLDGMTTLKSKFHQDVAISYKETKLCETTPGVRSYSGYIHLPPNSLNEPREDQNYPINMFFWFFEARKHPQTAPLALWLNGGPGGSSASGLLVENGPCFVNDDSNSTRVNPWSWNNEVNMLYIDQPVQVGYSFDIQTNITLDRSNATQERPRVAVANFTDGIPEQNNTFYVGTSSSQQLTSITNSTNHSAVAMWHFAQTWFDEFPHYKPSNGNVSLWTESYGGHYGPAFARYFNLQNTLIAHDVFAERRGHFIHLNVLGLINACVDELVQCPAYPEFAYRNTFGIEAINSSIYALTMENWSKHGGVRDLVQQCRSLAQELDPFDYGNSTEVNEACFNASEAIETYLIHPYQQYGKRALYDIAHPANDPFPPPYFQGYLNQQHVQRGVGAAVNHTWASLPVYRAFEATGDSPRGGYLDDLAYLLNHGTQVAMIYGDRDFICNWIGGESISLAIPYDKQENFARAGYEPINVNSSYTGGLVRQQGNLSFARVFQAGHMVPSYQPETSYKIFMRTMFGKDVATGAKDVSDDLTTKGPSSTWHVRQPPPAPPQPECYILAPSGCSEDEWQAVENGTAVIENYIFQSFGGGKTVVDESPLSQSNKIGANFQEVLMSTDQTSLDKEQSQRRKLFRNPSICPTMQKAGYIQ